MACNGSALTAGAHAAPLTDDKHPSLRITELGDGRVLIHDFAGCPVADVLAAVGLDFAALYPARPVDHHVRPERRPFPAANVLRAVEHEAPIAAVAASFLGNGGMLTKRSERGSCSLQNASRRLCGSPAMADARARSIEAGVDYLDKLIVERATANARPADMPEGPIGRRKRDSA
jgi:hypothetical protein